MPNFSQLFILKTFNAVGGLVEPLTRSYKFTGSAVVTTSATHDVTVNVTGGGGGAGAWDVAGNAGPGLVLGTTTADGFDIIINNLPVAGYDDTGRYFIKTHAAYTGSEYFQFTNAVSTTDGTPTNIFTIPIPNPSVQQVKVRVQGRQDTGANRCAFERQATIYNEGGSQESILQSNFTDKSNPNYDIQVVPAGSNLEIRVIGDAGQNLFWSGVVEIQGVVTDV